KRYFIWIEVAQCRLRPAIAGADSMLPSARPGAPGGNPRPTLPVRGRTLLSTPAIFGLSDGPVVSRYAPLPPPSFVACRFWRQVQFSAVEFPSCAGRRIHETRPAP